MTPSDSATSFMSLIWMPPPKDYEYGMRDFVIEDPDGNLIGVGQETRKCDIPHSPTHP